jgi:hypothetical protein
MQTVSKKFLKGDEGDRVALQVLRKQALEFFGC